MLDFAHKLTIAPNLIDDDDRTRLHQQGLSEEDVFDLAETVALFNWSNRMATATGMMPNGAYHTQAR